MRERAMLVGARLRFVTPPGGGTEVRLEVPVGEKP
jgi:signal transduction histidine kinase